MTLRGKIWLYGLMVLGVSLCVLITFTDDSHKSDIWFWRSMTGYANIGLLLLIQLRFEAVLKEYKLALNSAPVAAPVVSDAISWALVQMAICGGLIVLSWWLVAIAF